MRRSLPLVFILGAIIFTWPLLPHLTTDLPLGSESSATVPYFNLWSLGWNADRLRHGFQGYWEAPIFHPLAGAFAFSDPQPLTAFPAAILWPISPALAYNAILLAYLALAGWFTSRLLIHQGLPVPAGIAGGLFVQALPFLTHERGVIQLQALFGPVWALGAFWDLLEEKRAARAVELAVATAITFLTSEYYALYLVGMLGLVAIVRIGEVRRKRTVGQLALAIVIASLFILPVAVPQARLLRMMDFERSTASIEQTSAWAIDYLDPSPRLWVSSMAANRVEGPKQPLFPGAGLAGLAFLGVIVGVAGRDRRRWALALSGVAFVFFLVSLGSHLQFGGQGPFQALRRVVPGLSWMRSPYRAAVLMQLALAILAAEGLAWVYRRRRWLAYLLALMVLVEVHPLPEQLLATPDMNPAWAEKAREVGGSVILQLPWASGRETPRFEATTTWMLQSLTLEAPMVNGYSGFFPSFSSQLRSLLGDLPSSASLRALRALGVDLVVVHPDSLESQDETRLQNQLDLGELEIVGVVDDVRLIRLRDSSLQPAAYGGSWALRVEPTEGRLRVGAYAAVPDDRFYVYVPSVTPIAWSLVISNPGGERSFPVEPRGSGLLFHGSDLWLRLEAPVELKPGVYDIRLVDRETERVLGRASIEVP
ncbi:MAG TPA: hypothetical protein VJK02_00200 [Anaerolineales bacterium]|nr:hypothetical protein [Anaerolineales bacterium]